MIWSPLQFKCFMACFYTSFATVQSLHIKEIFYRSNIIEKFQENLLLAEVSWASFFGCTVSRTMVQTDWLTTTKRFSQNCCKMKLELQITWIQWLKMFNIFHNVTKLFDLKWIAVNLLESKKTVFSKLECGWRQVLNATYWTWKY